MIFNIFHSSLATTVLDDAMIVKINIKIAITHVLY